MKQVSNSYDVVVVGGGPAGMTAAITAATAGVRVLIIDKNPVLGAKLRITGGGRCNITNNTPNVRELLSAYKEAGKFLFSPFAQVDVPKTRAWLESIGIQTVEEVERRVFPVSQSAVAVTEALITELHKRKVEVKTAVKVQKIKPSIGTWIIETTRGDIHAKAVVVATGGHSHPETGSTGDALPWLAQLGHTIEAPHSSLVPVAVKESAVTAKLGGVSLPLVKMRVLGAGKPVAHGQGKLLFTHFGLSGPGVLNLSSEIGRALVDYTDVKLTIDLLPQYTKETFEDELLTRFMNSSNKLVRNQFAELLPTALVAPLLEQAAVLTTTPSHSVTVSMRRQIIETVKAFTLTPTHLLGEDVAIVSSGGVALPEIDFRNMESRKHPGLFVVGDVLNIERPSGGYSLQLSWTTGTVAGRAAALASRVTHKSMI